MALQIAQQQENDILLTFKEAQDYLKASRSTMYRLMGAGTLPAYKVGATWRFWLRDVRACVKRVEPLPESVKEIPVQVRKEQESERPCQHTETQLWCPQCIEHARKARKGV